MDALSRCHDLVVVDFFFFYFIHSHRCVMISHGGFNFHFPNGIDFELTYLPSLDAL